VPFPLRVVSVEASLYEGEAGFLLVNGADGELGILPHHAPLLATLAPGPLVIKDEVGGQEKEALFVGGGFIEVLPDRVTVLADVAERAEDISEASAETARRDIQERLGGTHELNDAERLEMETLLGVAEARLRMARMRRGAGR
jgi:F-type H+-transporting ATPase subunit epsilon